MRVMALMCLFLLTIFSQPAFAYLDPGSGSMLVAGLVGLLASLLFFLKGLFYKSRRTVLGLMGRTAKEDQSRHQLVFYSEGRQYWNTFKPVIDELVGRGEKCAYLTSDEQDPGLLYASEFISTKHIGTDIPWDLWELTVLDTIGRRIEEQALDALPTIIERRWASRIVDR